MKGERHPDKVVQEALAYGQVNGWIVIKSTGGSAHAWGVMRCPGDCPQVSVYSTPRSSENHARSIRRVVDRCPHGKKTDNG